jgi:uncharacterized protein (TIGR03435 family)
MRLLWSVAFLLSAVSPSEAQTPTFDVASVKPRTSCQSGSRGAGPNRGAVSPDRLDLQCRTVIDLVQTAYGRDISISGGPAWIGSEHYDIDAKAETLQSQETMRGPMLQVLLAERFQLKVHRESKEVPVYALAVGRGGPKLQPAQPGKCIPRGEPRQPGVYTCGVFAPSPAKDGSYMYDATMAGFCAALSAVLDRQVVDKTGIAGAFDIFIEAPPEAPSEAISDDRSLTGRLGSALLDAIQKAGLRLESAKGSKELLMIDHVERPSEN